ncbi:MAG: pirin family protein [Candidatus Thermoplasmatota archaeon]|nr:pirin family protein [Candidatus Thermoplasmatota archaeon]
MALNVKDGPERQIAHILEPVKVMEGAGVIVKRAIPSNEVPYEKIDPFLLLDLFDTSHPSYKGQAFPRHPHRGFEIITYLLAGEASHRDDFGNDSVIRGGGLQKITTGKGIWHEEGPTTGGEEPTIGLQLWINLAQKDKTVAPHYQTLEPEGVPVREMEGAKARVLVGDESPIRLHTPALYLDVTVPSSGALNHHIPADYQGFVLVLEGRGRFGSNEVDAEEGRFLLLGAGEILPVKASHGPVRYVLAAGEPHREPIRWMGPFVD